MELSRRTKLIVWLMLAPIVGVGFLNGFFNAQLFESAPVAFWAVDISFHLVYPLFFGWVLYRFLGIRPRHLGLLYPPPLVRELFLSSAFFAALLWVVSHLPQHIVWAMMGYPKNIFWYDQVVPNGPLYLPTMFYFAASAGLFESIAYISLPSLLVREYLTNFNSQLGFALASSLIFATVHWEQLAHGMVGAFVFGVGACLIFFKTRDLWPIVGAHFAIDVLALA